MEFEDLPLEMTEYICEKANLRTLLILSETSWTMNQICSKEIIQRKKAYLEEKRLRGLVDKYFKMYKFECVCIIPLGSYLAYTRHDIDLSDIDFDDEITEQYITGEKPILMGLFPGRDFKYEDNIQYSDGKIFHVLILKDSTDEDRKKVLRGLAEMNILYI